MKFRWLLLIICCFVTLAAKAQKLPDLPITITDQVGIFDMRTIRAHPLHLEVVKFSEVEGIITEEIRYNALPGVRVLAYLCYPRGAKELPGSLTVQVTPVSPPVQDATYGAVGIAICPTTGNMDADAKVTIGGPPFSDKFTDDPDKSWIYNNVIALVRMLEYLETRPEIDLSRTLVQGHQWGGWLAALVHAINHRVGGYMIWQGTGFYVGFDGLLNGTPALLSRKHYEMYSPASYAQYGSSPMLVGYALNDSFFSVDATIEYARKIKSPHLFTLIANSASYAVPRTEGFCGATWATYWMNGGEEPLNITAPQMVASEGKIYVNFSLTGEGTPIFTELLYSYGAPGQWSGRSWHRVPAEMVEENKYQAVIPQFAPISPIMAVALVESKAQGMVVSSPLLIQPEQLGLGAENSLLTPYPMNLQNFEDQSDMSIINGSVEFSTDSAEGFYAAKVTPGADGTFRLLCEAQFWANAKTLSFSLKGDGKPGPVVLTFLPGDFPAANPKDVRSTQIVLVPAFKLFPNEWNSYKVALNKVANLSKIRAISFSVGNRPVQLDQIMLEQ